jgi:hypothetical protein
MISPWMIWCLFIAASLALCAGPARGAWRALYAAVVGAALWFTVGPIVALLIVAGALLVADAWHWGGR